MSDNLPIRYTGRATWKGPGDHAVTITSDHAAGPMAIIPLADDGGRPTTSVLDDLLQVLGYTRTSTWSEVPPALVADCEPIHPGGE